jgi:hypothetical protein
MADSRTDASLDRTAAETVQDLNQRVEAAMNPGPFRVGNRFAYNVMHTADVVARSGAAIVGIGVLVLGTSELVDFYHTGVRGIDFAANALIMGVASSIPAYVLFPFAAKPTVVYAPSSPK